MIQSTRFLAALAFLACIFLLQDYRYLFAGLLCGYFFAWIGHFFFEKNRPATFTYPLWSLRGDLRMYGLMWAGRMAPELDRALQAYPPRA